jgi:hypothetical protein
LCGCTGTNKNNPESDDPGRSVKHVWDGTMAKSVSGQGSQESPYLVNNASELLFVADQITSGSTSYISSYIKLGANIDLEYYKWKPINNFQGHLNGDNHSINRLYIKGESSFGLFKALKNASVENLSIEGIIRGTEQAGLLTGVVTGSLALTNVKVSGEVTCSQNYVGGIVGQINNGSAQVSGCENSAKITGNNSVGGLIGTNSKSSATYDNCVNKGEIKGKNYVGGITGYLQLSEHETYIKNCVNHAKIAGRENVGGIVGCTTEPLMQCSFSKAGLVSLTNNNETVVANTLTSYVTPFVGNICGRNISDGVNTFGTLTECANEEGWANTMIQGGKGCSRVIEYKGKVLLFTTLNNYAVSEDGGHTFGPFINISNASTPTEVMPNGTDTANDTGNTQPYVLPDGRIMIMYRMHRLNKDAGYNYYSLRLRISDENGVFDAGKKPITFIEYCTGPTSGSPGGLWEPFPILISRDEATHKSVIYTYVSSDCHNSSEYTFSNGYHVNKLGDDILAPGTSQNTIMIPLTIYDGAYEEGSGKVEVGAPKCIFYASKLMRSSNARPGMTILEKLDDGSWCMTNENCEEQSTFVDEDGKTKGGYNMVTQISYTKDGINFTRPQTIIRPIHNSGDTNGAGKLFKCATSGVCKLPDGRLVISCASDETYEGCWPSDSSHYDQMQAYVTDKPVKYGDKFERGNGLTKLNIYNYNPNEYTVWGVCNFAAGRVFVSSQYGVNSTDSNGKITSPVDGTWIVSNDWHNIK